MTLLPVRSVLPLIEALESRIAPAVVFANPLPDIVAGAGKTGATIDLSAFNDLGNLHPYRTIVQFTTNIDSNPEIDGIQPGIILIELYDDLTPLTVQNFLSYVNSLNTKGDYDNTIIHRSFDFSANDSGATSGPGIDIVQGGGFEITGSTSAHVVTSPEVHNEYLLPNTRGTIALAKTGAGPNTGTSEWFFNVNDNSSILGSGNNGGFTVFGEVISGMEYVDIMAGLTVYDFGGTFTDLPLQGYNTDPDNNPSTAKPTPTANQFVRITDASVVKQTVIDTDLKYTVSIKDPGTGEISKLVTSSVKDSVLTLKYAAGKVGLAEVTVRAEDPTNSSIFVEDTFTVDVRPNLVSSIQTDGLYGVMVPGDKGTMKLQVSNNGAGTALGTVGVTVTLTKYAYFDTNGDGTADSFLQVSPTETKVIASSSFGINIAGGKSQVLSVPVQVPYTLAEDNGEYWVVSASVTPTGGQIANDLKDSPTTTVSGERFTDDNTALNGATHQLYNWFGDIRNSDGLLVRPNTTLTYVDPDAPNQLVSWTLKGGGVGVIVAELDTDGDPTGDISLLVDGTTLKSTLAATLPKGGAHAELNGVEFYTPLGTATLGLVDMDGPFTVLNGAKTITLGNLGGQWMMQILANPYDAVTKTALTVGRVSDYSILSFAPMASFSAVEWRDANPAINDVISLVSLGTLKTTGSTVAGALSRGDFEADLSISGTSPISSITIAGLLKDANIRTAGNITAVTVGGMVNSQLFLGVNAVPDEVSDFSASPLTLGSFTIKGIKGYTGPVFADSQVAAQTMGTVKLLGQFDTTSELGEIGFFADVIKSYNRTLVPTGAVIASNVTAPREIEHIDDFVVRVL